MLIQGLFLKFLNYRWGNWGNQGLNDWVVHSQYMALWFPCCYCCYSVTKSCPTLCDPMDCSMPGSSVLPEFAQIISIIYTALTYSFPNFEPVHCSMSSSNCCFLSCIQVLQEAGKMVWYSHLFKNFPQFVVVYTVKGFSIVNEAEVHVFLEFSRFSMIQQMLAIWSLVPLPFLNPAWTVESSRFTHFWSPTWRILNITLACEMSTVVQ